MLPNKASPVSPALLHGGLWIADAVYHPLVTPLLMAAQACGARIMTGRELAILQAADAFELFTGFAPSIDVMRQAFDAVMETRSVAAAPMGQESSGFTERLA
jgi:shikimate dehydrogenase